MKTLALALAVLVMAPAAAHAGGSGGFVSLGVGATANTGGDLANWGADGKVGSLYVGQRFGMVGLEVGLSAYGLSGPGGGAVTNVGLSAAGLFAVPVTPTISPYLRLGIEKTWMNRDTAADFSGTGWLASLGVEYKLSFGALGMGGIWADFTRHDASFVNDTVQRDGHIDTLSLGVTVGF